MKWYASFFKHCSSNQAISETSNTYICDANVPYRTYKQSPDVKLITVFRNSFVRIAFGYAYGQGSRKISKNQNPELAI